jgi:hypothetical protein
MPTPIVRPQPRPLGLALLVLTVAGLLLGPAPSASAANYRYWGYWQLTAGSWAFAQKGPDQLVPADGSVEGWRYAVDDGSGTRTPRAVLTFEQLCGSTPTQAGKKRVGLVLDFGRVVDNEAGATPPAPLATCAQVAPAATGAEVLAATTTVRTGNGLVCALGGYPAAGCGGEMATLTDAQKAPDQPVTIAAPGATGPAAPAATSSTATAPATASTATATAAAASATEGSSSGIPLLVWVLLAFAFVVLAGVASRRRRATGA